MPEDEQSDLKRIVEAGYDFICERYEKVYAGHHEARELREEYGRRSSYSAVRRGRAE